MNARQEAFDRLGGRYDPRVLEPAPPAVAAPPWFADDPVETGTPLDGLPVVSPVGTGDVTWAQLVEDDAEIAPWAAERWLAAHPRLSAPPARLAETRVSLHRLAEHVVSPTRQRANGKIGLRWTRGGFGTPFFGNDVQVRVTGDVLTVQIAGREQHGQLVTLKDAAEFVGFDLTRQDAAYDSTPLEIDVQASSWLGELFGFAVSVLEQLRADAPHDAAPSRVQLWPEHFDMAVEIGAEATGRRAAFGISPGDESQPEPYLYVSPWASEGFDALPLGGILDAPDQRDAALAFFRARLAAA
ncbi:MAG: hypothetical protein JHC95_07585 [Solirubrobacteraceae bacterium]|nr:hypothetical protein [Solirubrobacteraceae bacterium]